MSILAKLFVALLMLICLIPLAWAQDPAVPELTLLQTVAYPADNGDYTIRLGGWSSFAAVKPARYKLQTPSLRLADESTIPLCGDKITDRCFQIATTDENVLTITLHKISFSSGPPALIFHPVADGGQDMVVPIKALVSPYGPNVPRLCAAAGTILLLGLVGLIMCMRTPVRLPSRHEVSQLRALFISKATSSYSLSNLQLYIWMVAAITAYIYLLLARIMVQGNWSFIDVPESIVGVALISVSTSVLSSGVNSANGGGGSGTFGPAATDLISSGADVAPERVQQLLWTLLGAPIFVILAYRTDPATIGSIQEVPSYFLQLMGVSSAGYLGGKIARGPGPKITNVQASLETGPSPFITLVVTGSDIQTKSASYYLTNLAIPGNTPVALPSNLGPTSKIDSTGVATELDLRIPWPLITPHVPGGTWNMQFTIRAADGEMAEWQF